MKVYSSPSVWVGNAEYASADKEAFLSAVTKFAHQTDAKAAIIPIIVPISGTSTATYELTRFYDDPAAGANASAFQDFTAPRMTSLLDTYSPRPLAQYLDQEVDPVISTLHGLRQKFYAASSTASHDALSLVHDALLEHVAPYWAQVPGLFVTFAAQPITQRFIQQSGDLPQGVDATHGPYFWYVLNVGWTEQASDALVQQFVAAFDEVVNEGLEKAGLRADYIYMNDADKGQPVFQNYPEQNLLRLKEIRSKYDPRGVLTKQMPGGWKVEDA